MAGVPSSAASAAPPRVARWPWLAAGALLVGLLVIYPPFRVVRRGAEVPAVAAGAFTPAEFATRFWAERLQPVAAGAPELAPLLAALRRDPGTALQRHGRKVGLGNAAYFLARGAGRVVAIDRSRVLVEVDGAQVALRTGPVFGNVIRDGCGLLEVNQVPGLAEFNALSAELNRLVEERVQPALRARLAVGATVVFAGCAEAPESLPAAGSPLLTFIPIQAEVKP